MILFFVVFYGIIAVLLAWSSFLWLGEGKKGLFFACWFCVVFWIFSIWMVVKA